MKKCKNKNSAKWRIKWHFSNAFTAYLPLPGYSRKHITCAIDDGVLCVHAFTDRHSGVCKRQVVASFLLPKHFRLPLEIDAIFDNGLLSIFVEDKKALDGKIIPVIIKKSKKNLKSDNLKGLKSLKVGEIDGINSEEPSSPECWKR